MRPVYPSEDGTEVLQFTEAIQKTIRFIRTMIGNQIIQKVFVRQLLIRILSDQITVKFDRRRMIGHVPVPCGMAFRLVQDPLASLFTR